MIDQSTYYDNIILVIISVHLNAVMATLLNFSFCLTGLKLKLSLESKQL